MFKLESPTEKLFRQRLEEALEIQANLTEQVQQLKQGNQQLEERVEKLHLQLENATQALIQAQNATKTLEARLESLKEETSSSETP